MTVELNTTLYPRMKVSNGLRAAGTPALGAIYKGITSGFEITVKQVITTGSWTAGTAAGMIEFDDFDGNRTVAGERFDELLPVVGDGEFKYLGLGSYDFTEVATDIHEIQWHTFVVRDENGRAHPVTHIPWDKWTYTDHNYTTSVYTGPNMVSQDFEGKAVFYPQTLYPFAVSFIYQRDPQVLSAYTDVPTGLPAEYHDWISWEALMVYAKKDKNPTLFSYAAGEAIKYRLRAEKNLLPAMTYRANRYYV